MDAILSSEQLTTWAVYPLTWNHPTNPQLVTARSSASLRQSMRPFRGRCSASFEDNAVIPAQGTDRSSNLPRKPAASWALTLFKLSRNIVWSNEEHDSKPADQLSAVSTALSRHLQSHSKCNEEESFLDEKAGANMASSEHELLSNTELIQSRSAKFTAEKARMLRQELRSTETWHDFMYHSPIASRLAAPDI